MRVKERPMTTLDPPASFTTLPRGFYLDDTSLFESETARIWYREWLYLAHTSELAQPGSYVVRRLLGEEVLVLRTESGELTAHLNVCRHRGARMVDEPCGRMRRIVCPYHQWTYNLDGRLRAAPSMPHGETVDYEALGLHAVPLQVWNGLVFGSVGEAAPEPLDEAIARFAPALVEYEPESWRPVERRTYPCRANWKVVLENYLECYHCAGSHPEFCVTADPRVRSTEEFNRQAFDPSPFWGMDAPLRRGTLSASATGEPVSAVPLGAEEPAWGHARAFGTWCAGSVVYCYADYAMVHQIDPVSARETRVHLTWFVHEDAPERSVDIPSLTHVWHMTTEQDVALIERTQAGLRSRRYTPGPLSVIHEPYIHSSLTTYLARMAGDGRTAELLAGA
jgi:phenylpropionate dioxygenase-like ring-hydroxylating dioxygenase large terminal subunit